jgi:methionyl-tRNA formyltransferase
MGYEIAGVSAPPYHPDGREDRLYKFAALDGAGVIPGNLRADILPANVDLIIAAHSWDFISQKTLNRTKLGAIGYHPSLLPRHRGRDAVRWALHMGDPITGGTVYWFNQNVDGGAIAAQDWCWIRPEDTAQSLWFDKLQPLGLRLFEKVLTDISGGRLVKTPQDESLATWEPSWERPPIMRPDLLQIGAALQGYEVVTV